ncbi:MAG: peptidase E [Clostridia bacterium]|nr:peptidase E [Clostridia bacterium]
MSKGTVIGIGGGFDGEYGWSLARRIIAITGKQSPNYLLIPTTGYDFSRGEIPIYSKMGCKCEVLCLTNPCLTEEIIADMIRRADIINVPGGNLKFCMDVWNRTNAAHYLREGYENGKIFFGSSSGSMCWFRQGFDDCGPDDDFEFIDALGLLPYNNVPHYEGAFWHGFDDFAKKTRLSTVACENDTAICCSGGKYSLIISEKRPDARVWFFDAQDNYKRYDLTAHPEILEKM